MTLAELIIRVRGRLNRPADDDKFPPEAIHPALFDAARALRREIGLFDPRSLDFEDILETADQGSTYDLAEEPQAGLRVFTPPGFTRGIEIFPSDFGQPYGYVLAGKTIRLLQPRVYTPGLYVRYVAETPAINDQTVAVNVLPEWAHTAWYLDAAARLARTPGSRINAGEVQKDFDREWADVRRQRKMVAPAYTPEETYPAWYEGMA